MKINSIGSNTICRRVVNSNLNKTEYGQSLGLQSDVFTKSTQSINFGGTLLCVPKAANCITAKEAANYYASLSNGDYINIYDDEIKPENKQIRLNNYSFLDKLASLEEKVKFIKFYEDFTGFPDLKTVSEKMEREFIKGMINAEYIGNTSTKTNHNDVLWAGYGYCSTLRNMALPGSDMDASFVIIRGDGSDDEKTLVDKFKSYMWFETDQRILSYNHPSAFPQVYTLKQVLELNNFVENKLNISPRKARAYLSLKKQYLHDSIAANVFLRDLAKILDKSQDKTYSKEEIKNFAFLAESFKEGKMLFDKQEKMSLKKSLENSPMFLFSNVSQIHALCATQHPKPKISSRKEMIKAYPSMTINEKFAIIKDMIMGASEDNINKDKYFEPTEDTYSGLIKEIT